ncbi:MAG: hypothetical protein KatS3mg110_1653 [Pirellulaceae bacterium]|nr:MAG: hypothetical protein KatS3mg110_1653 [Pirellulaceae bacterium]
MKAFTPSPGSRGLASQSRRAHAVIPLFIRPNVPQCCDAGRYSDQTAGGERYDLRYFSRQSPAPYSIPTDIRGTIPRGSLSRLPSALTERKAHQMRLSAAHRGCQTAYPIRSIYAPVHLSLVSPDGHDHRKEAGLLWKNGRDSVLKLGLRVRRGSPFAAPSSTAGVAHHRAIDTPELLFDASVLLGVGLQALKPRFLRAVAAPWVEALSGRPPGAELLGQIGPGSAGGYAPPRRSHHLPKRRLSADQSSPGGHQVSDQRQLLIGKSMSRHQLSLCNTGPGDGATSIERASYYTIFV